MRRIPTRVLGTIVTAALLAFAGPATAATFWVATNGSDNNDGSSGTPWLTIAWAVNHVPDGSEIRVRTGTYGRVSVSGKSFAQGVVVRSDVPYKALLRSGS